MKLVFWQCCYFLVLYLGHLNVSRTADHYHVKQDNVVFETKHSNNRSLEIYFGIIVVI